MGCYVCAGPPHGGLGIERILGQGVTDGIRASTFAARARAGQGRGPRRMARVVPKWTYGMAYVPALDTRTCTEGSIWAFVVCFRTKWEFGPGTLVRFRQLQELGSWRIALIVSGPYARDAMSSVFWC